MNVGLVIPASTLSPMEGCEGLERVSVLSQLQDARGGAQGRGVGTLGGWAGWGAAPLQLQGCLCTASCFVRR